MQLEFFKAVGLPCEDRYGKIIKKKVMNVSVCKKVFNMNNCYTNIFQPKRFSVYMDLLWLGSLSSFPALVS